VIRKDRFYQAFSELFRKIASLESTKGEPTDELSLDKEHKKHRRNEHDDRHGTHVLPVHDKLLGEVVKTHRKGL
jgi:hypothetical protein